MSVNYKILVERSLVYVRYAGKVNVADSVRSLADYTRDPEMRPGQNLLINLAEVTEWERNYAALMLHQARKADIVLGNGHDVLLVYHAPTIQSQSMARQILRSWDQVAGVVPLVMESEAAVLDLLGQPEATFDTLLQSA